MVYITQFGGWWSMTEEQWKLFVEYMLANPKEGYDLDLVARSLRNRPSSIRVDGNRRSGDFSYYTTKPFDHIVEPLDWKESDWEYALEEAEMWKEIKDRNK